MKFYISYLRLSKKKKAKDGQPAPEYYGLDAQRTTINQNINGTIIKEYVEIESGTRKNLSRRTEVRAAINHCKQSGATLVVARLDRLGRDAEFVNSVMNSCIDILFCDFKVEGIAGRMVLQIISSVAEYERNLISERTKQGLAVARAKGKRLGNPKGHDMTKVVAAAKKARKENHHLTNNVKLKGRIELMYHVDKMTYAEIADKLNEEGLVTTYNKRFNKNNVRNILV